LHQTFDRRVERHHATVILELALERQHVAMAVNDAGFRRAHCSDAGERRLEPPRGRAVDDLDAFDAVDRGLLEDAVQPLGLGLVGGDDQLAALAMRHAVGRAKFVEHPPRARAVIGALRAGRIIEPGVDHLAVARGHAGTDPGCGFRDDHLVAGERDRARHREPDHSGADHQHLHLLSPSPHASTGSPT
jgi:hypothetical protein